MMILAVMVTAQSALADLNIIEDDITISVLDEAGDSFEYNWTDSKYEDIYVMHGDIVTVNYDYENNFTEDILGYISLSAISGVDPEFVDYNEETAYLLPNTSASDSFEFEVPYDLDNGAVLDVDFTITITAEDEDAVGEEYDDSAILNFVLLKYDQDLHFNNVELVDDTIGCNAYLNLTLNVTNTGENNVTPEYWIFDENVEDTFNTETGYFTSDPLYEFISENELEKGVILEEDISINMTYIESATTLYIYAVSPFFWTLEGGFYIGDSATVNITAVEQCLNTDLIDAEIVLNKDDDHGIKIDLTEEVDGNYIYLNEEVEQEYDLVFTIEEVDEDNDLIECEIVTDTTFSCDAPAESEVGTKKYSLYVTEDVSDNTLFAGTVTVTVLDTIEISLVSVNGNPVEEDGDSTILAPLDYVEIEFTVTNGLDYSITDVNTGLMGDFALESETTFNLETGIASIVTLNGTLPADIVSGEYEVDLFVKGTDYENNTIIHGDNFTFNLVVEQESAGVQISGLTVEDEGGITCKPDTDLTIDLTNTGSNDEDDIIVTVTGTSLFLTTQYDEDGDETFIEMSANGDTYQTILTIPAENLTSTSNDLTVMVSYRNGATGVTGTVSIAKGDCLESFSPEETEDWLLGNGELWEETFSINLSEEGYGENVEWFVQGPSDEDFVSVLEGELEYTFSGDESGDYIVKVVINANSEETQTWDVEVTAVPLTTDYTTNIPENVTEDELLSFADLEIENSYGKIVFEEAIDLTEIIYLDNVVNIASGLVAVDTEEGYAPELNAPATITIKKNYVDPLILVASEFEGGTYELCASSVCTEISNADGEFVFEVTGFSSYQVVEELSADISVSDVTIDDEERGANVTVAIPITNAGTLDTLTDMSVELEGFDTDYEATISLTETTLAAGETINAELTLLVPEDSDAGLFEIGIISVVGNVDGENVSAELTVYLELKSSLAIEDVEINGKSNGDLSIDEDNEIEVKVLNDYTVDMEDVVITATLLDVDGDDLDEESEDFDLDQGDSETITLEFDLFGEDLDEESYTLVIVVEGEGVDGSEHESTYEIEVDVDRESHKVTIKKATLSATTLQCSRQTTVTVEVENVGTKDEDDIEIRLVNTALGIDEITTSFNLEEYSDNDNDRTHKFYLNLEDVAASTYPLTIELYRDGDLEESEELTLSVLDCVTTTTTTQTQPTTSTPDELASEMQQGLADYLKAKEEQQKKSTTTSGTFTESGAYTAMLIVLIVLIFITMMLGMAVAFKKKR